MPSSSKTKWSQLKVGVMAITALGLLAVLIVFMAGSNPLFRKTTDVYTYLGDSAAMTKGATPVRLNGILIGTLKEIELSGSSDPSRIIRLTLSIDNQWLTSVPVDSLVSLAQQNLLGTRYVNIAKGKSAQTIEAGVELKAEDTPDLQDFFKQGSSVLSVLQDLANRANNIIASIDAGQGTIGLFLKDPKLYNQSVSLLGELNKLAVALNAPDSTVGKLIHQSDLYDDLRGTVGKANTLMDGLDRDINHGDGTLGKLLRDPQVYDQTRDTIDEAHGAIKDLRDLIAKVNKGDGDIGKLLTSNDIHDQFKSTLGRVDTLLDKINNGQGTISQLLNNPLLYDNLTGTTSEMHELMKDFRSNPKKFLRIKLSLF